VDSYVDLSRRPQERNASSTGIAAAVLPVLSASGHAEANAAAEASELSVSGHGRCRRLTPAMSTSGHANVGKLHRHRPGRCTRREAIGKARDLRLDVLIGEPWHVGFVQSCRDVRGVAALADDATGKATMRRGARPVAVQRGWAHQVRFRVDCGSITIISGDVRPIYRLGQPDHAQEGGKTVQYNDHR
jgi:hypothetical protein